MYTRLAKKELSHPVVFSLNSNVVHGTTISVHTQAKCRGCYNDMETCPCLGLPFSSQGPTVSSPCCPVLWEERYSRTLFFNLSFYYIFCYQDAQELLIPSCVCVLVAQSCLTLQDPRDYSPSGSSVHGILRATILEWVATSFSTYHRIIYLS